MTLLLLFTEQGEAVVVTGIVDYTSKARTLAYTSNARIGGMPIFLTDEAGVILTDEAGAPLLEEAGYTGTPDQSNERVTAFTAKER